MVLHEGSRWVNRAIRSKEKSYAQMARARGLTGMAGVTVRVGPKKRSDNAQDVGEHRQSVLIKGCSRSLTCRYRWHIQRMSDPSFFFPEILFWSVSAS